MYSLPVTFFADFSADVYNICYVLYSFIFTYKPLIGGGGRLSWVNPISGENFYLTLPTLGPLSPIIDGISDFFNISVDWTFFELLSGSFIIVVLAYAIIKYLK